MKFVQSRLSAAVVVTLIAILGLTINPAAAAIGVRETPVLMPDHFSTSQLAFSDEFATNSLDASKWSTEFPWGRDRSSVGELQYYAPDAFTFEDGALQITATENPAGNSHRYDSGLISSHSSFDLEYGRFEMRGMLPQGQGLWPAFWLLPVNGSWPPEIDIFESLGHDSDTVYMNVHWEDDGQHGQKQGELSGPDFSSGYHTFTVDWTPNTLTWYVDGVQQHQVINRSPVGPMYVIANLAVGGDWPGSPDASTAFPASFDIDYIRVYQGLPDAPLPPDNQAEPILPTPTGNAAQESDSPASSVSDKKDKKDKKHKKGKKGSKAGKGKKDGKSRNASSENATSKNAKAGKKHR